MRPWHLFEHEPDLPETSGDIVRGHSPMSRPSIQTQQVKNLRMELRFYISQV